MSDAKKLTDHGAIREWAEARGGRPSVARGTSEQGEGAGVLRFDFGEPQEALEEIPWKAFFETFEDRKLAVLVQEKIADGSTSRFFKFVER